MNVWVQMTSGCRAGNSDWKQVQEELVSQVSSGTLKVPITAANYLELWHRHDGASREHVAGTIRSVTQYVTYPSAYLVRKREAERVAQAWTEGFLRPLTGPELIGHGVNHAFGRLTGRFRFVKATAADGPEFMEGQLAKPPPEWEQIRNHPSWEWFNLAGDDFLFNLGTGFDRTPEHRYGDQVVAQEMDLRKVISGPSKAASQLKEIILAEKFETIREDVESECARRRVSVPPDLRSGCWSERSFKAMELLIDMLPSSKVWSVLRFLKHQNRQLPWEQHDWTDLWLLSSTIPYVDAVCTEKRWSHFASAGGLSSEYQTDVISGVNALGDWLQGSKRGDE